MKKIYGLIGFSGFSIVLLAASAEEMNFTHCTLLVLFGVILICLSVILNRIRILKMRRQRRAYIAYIKTVKTASFRAQKNINRRRTAKPGILEIIRSESKPSPGAGQTAVC